MSVFNTVSLFGLLPGILLAAPPTPPPPDKREEPDPVPPTSAVNPPPLPSEIKQGNILAIITFEDGSVLNITDTEVSQEPDKSLELNMADLIQLKYKRLTERISQAIEGKKIADLKIADPAMQVMDRINIALQKDYGPDLIDELEKFILQLDEKTCPEKPNLIIIFALLMLGSGKINAEKAQKLLVKAVSLDPKNPEFYSIASKFFIARNNFEEGYKYLVNGLRLSAGMEVDHNLSLNGWETDLKILMGKLPTERMLEIPQFLVLLGEYENQNKKYDKAISWLESAEKAIGLLSFEKKEQQERMLAELSLKKADILVAQEEYLDAYKALEKAVKTYRKLSEQAPDNALLHLKLAAIYFSLYNINRKLGGYQEYLEFHAARCLPLVKDELEKAVKGCGSNSKILFDAASLYAALGDLDKAKEILSGLVKASPNNPQYLLQLGDYNLLSGEIDEAFKSYEQALAAAGDNLDMLANLHLRFTFLKTQAETTLVHIKTGKSNTVQMLLNFGITALFTYLNPMYLVQQTVGQFANKLLSKHYTEGDWNKILEKARALESKSFDSVLIQVRAQKKFEVLFFIAEVVFQQSNMLAKQAEEIGKKQITSKDEIEALKDVAKSLKDQAKSMLTSTFRTSLVKIPDQEFEAAKAAKDPKKMFSVAAMYLNLYLFLLEKSSSPDVDKELKKIMLKQMEVCRKKGLEVLAKIREFSKEQKDHQLAFAVFVFASEKFDGLQKTVLRIYEGKLKKDRDMSEELGSLGEKLVAERNEALAATIQIAKDNKDFHTLVELGKAISSFGPFSRKAFEEAIDLIKDDKSKLAELGGLIIAMMNECHEKDFIKELGIIETLRNLAISVNRRLAEMTEGEENIVVCRQLWKLGAHEDAYLGYLAAINYYKTIGDKASRVIIGNLFYELGLMSIARGNTGKGIEWFKRAIKETPLPKDLRVTIEKEIKYLESGALPPKFTMKGGTVFTPQQIRAAQLLYVSWTADHPSLVNLEAAVENLYIAKNLRAKVKVTADDNGLGTEIAELTFSSIIVKGQKQTKLDVIMRELDYAGIKPGDLVTMDMSALAGKLAEASNRIKTFVIKDVKFVERDGQVVLEVDVKEPIVWDFKVGGGAGNIESMININFGYNNLFGGGEKIGISANWRWFYADGYKDFNTWGGNIYYFDPHLFAVGKTPVSGGFKVERAARMNFQGNTMETLLGGSVTLGFKVAEKTTLSISPQFYYVSGANGLYSYYQPSLKAALEVDGRDNWLLPKSGYYVFTSLEAGFRFGSSDEYYKVNGNKTTLENKFSQFFLNNYNEGRYYVLLPGDMVLAFRGMFGMGYNLAGGGQYIAGGPLNPYFRASKGIQSGYGLVGGSIELRAPVIDLNYVQMQFYAFGDGGFILGGGPSYGVGPGLRLAVPYLGVVNFGYGWPGGFFIWFGDLGWN